MDDSRVVTHREPLWLGPVALARWPLKLVVDTVVVDPARCVHKPPPTNTSLPASAHGVLRRSEPLPDDGDAPADADTGGLVRYELSRYDRQFATLTGTMETYLGRFSPKTRSTLRRKMRKFAKASGGTIDKRAFTKPDQVETFWHQARTISQHTYQERLYDAGLPSDRRFLDEMKSLAAEDRVRAWILFLDSKPISYLYCSATGDKLNYDFLGFLPEYHKLSPGTVLQMLAFEDLFEEQRFRLFDFSEGEGAHKRLFSTDSMACANVLYLRRTMTTSLFLFAHRTVRMLSDRADQVATRLGVKTALKRLVRKQNA
ncbi:hypothetical protein CCR80_09635 [Rhodothalassium salexigens]|uniref:GNAT family N-acetyltransferase n=1 Tax=Rhodothalassium salexigens TaxID=1086 RepID=UPI0019141E02|nr:GNAT family N-acetyltransferase [Rhodothalassium salexigens]MBK5921289.1 hypothetical protein [Rhodothalassium salexigens]